MKKLIILSILCIYFFLSTNCFCSWYGPIEVVSGPWGNNAGEFGFKAAQSEGEDAFPDSFGVNEKGEIYICDPVQDVIHKYDKKGVLIKTITSPPEHQKCWNILPAYDSFNNVRIHPKGGFLIYCADKSLFFDGNDNLIGNIEDLKAGWPIIFGEKGYYFSSGSELNNTLKYHVYSFKGEYLGAYKKSQIDEFGEINRNKSPTGKFKYQIKYNDNYVYHANNETYLPEAYFRDKFKTLFYYSRLGSAYRQTGCSDEVTEFSIPESIIDQNRPPREENLTAYFNWTPTVIEGYGWLVVSENGDLYCYKRTPETYSILKWVWIDSPDAPHSLYAESAGEALSLSWEAPGEDADKVKEYEIVRSTDVCGPFDVIGKVEKDTVTYVDKEVKKGETYYYKVRAVKEDGYSGYSNKAFGQLSNEIVDVQNTSVNEEKAIER